MPKNRHIYVHLPGRQLGQSVILAIIAAMCATCARCTPTQTKPQQAQEQSKPVSTTIQLQFRFKAQQLVQDINPPRIEAAIRGFERMERFKIFDSRASDVPFVTLVIVLSDPDPQLFAALQRVLTSIPSVRVFAVSTSRTLTPLETIAPDRLPELAGSNIKL